MLNTSKFIILKDGRWHDSACTKEEMLECFTRAMLAGGAISVLKVEVSATSLKNDTALWNICDVASSTGAGLS